MNFALSRGSGLKDKKKDNFFAVASSVALLSVVSCEKISNKECQPLLGRAKTTRQSKCETSNIIPL